jgi:hypothetical protein
MGIIGQPGFPGTIITPDGIIPEYASGCPEGTA